MEERMQSSALKEAMVARTRKPKARPKDVVFGCIEERMLILRNTESGGVIASEHIVRLDELLDELKRATSNAKEEE